MKKLLLALASAFAAVGLMAAATDTGGTVTFKTFYSSGNSAKVSTEAGAAVAGPAATGGAGFYAQLLDATSLQPILGVLQGGGSTALAPVRAAFKGTTGYVASGGDWALDGVKQGVATSFKVVAYFAPNGTETWADVQKLASYTSGISGAAAVTPGGNDLVPPGPAGQFAWGAGTAAWSVTTTVIPEPSVFALGLIGLGAFALRRRV